MSTIHEQGTRLLQRAGDPGGVDINHFLVRELVPAAATDDRVTVVDHVIPPRTLASPWHVHEHTVEISIVVAGEVGVRIGEQEMTAGVGDLVHKPARIWHAFWNAGDEPARLIELLSPSGFEHFFWGLGAALAAGKAEQDVIADIAAQHDLEVDLSNVAELMQRHGLER